MTSDTMNFLRALRRNNNRDWFHAHDAAYRAAKKDFLELVSEVLERLVRADGSLSGVDPSKALFRINRDVRFSKNKEPYKNHLSAFLSIGGRKGPQAGYYIHAEPGSGILAGGCWMPEPEHLSCIRQEIDYNLDDWRGVLESARFRNQFGELDREAELKRPPKGFAADNPALEWLRLKSFTASVVVADADWLRPDAATRLADKLAVLTPMVQFLNRALVV